MLDLSTLYAGISSSVDTWRLAEADLVLVDFESSTSKTSCIEDLRYRLSELFIESPDSLSSLAELRLGSEDISGLSRIILRDPDVKGRALLSFLFLPES